MIKLSISPHIQAPMFAGPDAHKVLADVLTLASSGKFSTDNAEIREAFRQAGMVNLWFFLKIIAGYSGPYEKLTPTLHADMTNFYQLTLTEGTKAAGFIGRSHYKSSCWTHGANTWELVRNPELEIALGSSIFGRSVEFLHQTQDTIENNEFFGWLYPEYVPENSRALKGWDDEQMTLPNKLRNKRTANLKPITVGGSTAGIHADLLKLDDIVGDAQLDSQRRATADMARIGNWFRSSVRTLVKDWKTSRVVVAGTRYSPDDPYEWPMTDCKQRIGYWDELPEDYSEKPDGEWLVYYRTIRERGQIIFPEAFSEEGLNKLMETDFWTYMTQYMNNPYTNEANELSEYQPKKCFLDHDMTRGYVLSTEFGEEILLASCDVVCAVDPAATDKGVSARTSRSVLIMMATDPKGRKFVFELRAGFIPSTKLFDWMFDVAEKYRSYLRVMTLEAQGPFKVLVPIIRKEEQTRKQSLPLRPAGAIGDKVARIRTALLPLLQRGQIYVVEPSWGTVYEELRVFPGGRRRDVLDALEIAESSSWIPDERTEDSLYEEDEDDMMGSNLMGANPVTGY